MAIVSALRHFVFLLVTIFLSPVYLKAAGANTCAELYADYHKDLNNNLQKDHQKVLHKDLYKKETEERTPEEALADYISSQLSQYTFGPMLDLLPGETESIFHWVDNPGRYEHITRLTDLKIITKQETNSSELAKIISGGLNQKVVEENILKQLEINSQYVSLLKTLPDNIQKLTNKMADELGYKDKPNCFNAVCLWLGIQDQVRHLENHEAEELIGTYLEKINPGEEIHTGDVIAFRDTKRNDYLLHFAIFLNREYIWEKATFEDHDTWSFQTLQQSMWYSYKDSAYNGRVKMEFYRLKR